MKAALESGGRGWDLPDTYPFTVSGSKVPFESRGKRSGFARLLAARFLRFLGRRCSSRVLFTCRCILGSICRDLLRVSVGGDEGGGCVVVVTF